MKKRILSIFLVLVFFASYAQNSFAQSNTADFTSSSEITFDFFRLALQEQGSSTEKTWSQKKHPFVALGGVLGFNILLASWNRYMIGSGWAKTGWSEWDHFWERELKWDRDWYWTNYVLHPYQGSMYYMASRGSNLNQAESFAVTLLGSAFWEYLCECNAPSKNDMIYTSVGSFCVGEMLFRLSQEANEINRLFGLALNPQRLWTEYIWQIKQKNTHSNINSLSVGIDLGNSVTKTKIKNYDSSAYTANENYPVFGMFDFNVVYNDPYGFDSNTPYSQFDLYFQGGLGNGSGVSGPCAYESIDEKMFYDIRIFSDAVLLARPLVLSSEKDTTLALTMIYDFDWHSFYMISSLAPGFAFKQRIQYEQSTFEWQAHLAGILLGTTDYYYIHRKVIELPKGTLRSYNHNVGAETVLKFKYDSEKAGTFALNFRGYAMYAFYDQLQECTEAGWDLIGLLNASFEYPLSKKVRIGFSEELLAKAELFNNMNNVYYLVNTAKVFARLKLK